MEMFISSALAQTSTSGAHPASNPVMQFVPLILIFLVFYFLMIRPQKKRMEQEQSFLKTLSKGDEVYTKSGMVGTVAGLADQFITLEISDGVKIKVIRNQIGGPLKSLLGTAKDDKNNKETNKKK